MYLKTLKESYEVLLPIMREFNENYVTNQIPYPVMQFFAYAGNALDDKINKMRGIPQVATLLEKIAELEAKVERLEKNT